MGNPYKGLRILHVCAVDFTARHFLAPLAFNQQQQGATVAIACSTGKDANALQSAGMQMIPLNIPRSLQPFQLLKEARALAAIIRKFRPDVLHTHTPVASLVARVVGTLMGVKTIIYTVHGFTFHEYSGRLGWLLHWGTEKFGSYFHDAMLCVSREDARVARRTGFHAPKGIFNIPNGVEPAPYIDVSEATIQKLREEFSIPKNSQVVGYFGRLTREKGTVELVEALFPLFREFPNLQALIVGPVLSTERDRVMDELKFRIVDEGVEDRIHFVGYRHDVPAVLQLCDVFCLPSWREGFPVTVLEAMMAGRAIVGTRIRGIREMIRTEEHGLLVPIRSTEALRNALKRLLGSPELRAELGTRARQRALQLYTLKHQLQRTNRAYQQVLKVKP